MRRSLTAVLGGPALAALILLGAAPAAHAGTHKPSRSVAQPFGHGEHATDREHRRGCDHTCTPAPTPPPGGWPCQQTHSCKPPKHPHCPPPKHHHPKPKPPVWHPTPKPPVVHPRTPVVTPPLTTPAAPPQVHHRTPELAYTGASDLFVYGYAGVGLGLVGLGGGLLRRFRRVSDEIRGALR